MSKYEIVGTYQPRNDSLEKVMGHTKYISDICMPGMLHGKVLRSPYAHAKIVKIDTSAAESMPGVMAVVTAKDFPYIYGRMIVDEPFFAHDTVRYVGESVAAVAAIDEETAEAALEKIRVEYEKLPAVLSIEDALKEGAPLIHPDLGDYRKTSPVPPKPGTNICAVLKVRKGNIDEGFARSDFIFEHTFTHPTVHHCYIEPTGAIADVDPAGNITIISGTQGAHAAQQLLAGAMGLPVNKIRIIQPPYGGGFGGKVPLHLEPIATALALKCRRPVRIVRNREEEFTASSVRHASKVTIKSGVTKDGKIIARKVEAILDGGAYARTGPSVLRNGVVTAAGPYDIPSIWLDGLCVYTNKVPAASLRGYGTPQVAWAYECHNDIIAKELNMDPVEFRLKNVLREGSINANGEKVKHIALDRCIERAAEEIGWNEPSAPCKPGRVRGKGIASVVKASTRPAQSSVILRLHKSGVVRALIGASEMGQGVNVVVAHVVAEELGIPLDKVFVMQPDTDYAPYDDLTVASKATFHTGNAARAAAIDLRNRILEMASSHLGIPMDNLKVDKGMIISKDNNVSMWITDLFGVGQYSALNEIEGRGTFISSWVKPMDPETGFSDAPVAFWMYAAHAAEVEVDLETGHVEVLKVAAAHDLGQAVSRLTCEQQIQGGVVFALSQALWEETKFNEKGKIMNPTFLDYKILTSTDTPEVVPIIVEDAPHEYGPYGAKGIGEIVTTPVAAAIGNAVYDATGVRVYALPLSPENVRNALRTAKKV